MYKHVHSCMHADIHTEELIQCINTDVSVHTPYSHRSMFSCPAESCPYPMCPSLSSDPCHTHWLWTPGSELLGLEPAVAAPMCFCVFIPHLQTGANTALMPWCQSESNLLRAPRQQLAAQLFVVLFLTWCLTPAGKALLAPTQP